MNLSSHTPSWIGLAQCFRERVGAESELGASSQWTTSNQRMICNSAFFSWDPGGTPSPPCTAVSSFIKWGWCLLSSLAPSYLTDRLWGLMKLCQQCFQFLERSYLWTFQVLYRYISDLSFLCAVILACHFYLFYKAPANVMATSDGHQSSELPSHAPAWCRITWSWNHKEWSPLWL